MQEDVSRTAEELNHSIESVSFRAFRAPGLTNLTMELQFNALERSHLQPSVNWDRVRARALAEEARLEKLERSSTE